MVGDVHVTINLPFLSDLQRVQCATLQAAAYVTELNAYEAFFIHTTLWAKRQTQKVAIHFLCPRYHDNC